MSVSVGVVGLGYWGPNLARNFDGAARTRASPGSATGTPSASSASATSFPGARAAGSFDELLADPELDAVVVATPVPTHAELARRALEAGKHVFVEKPLAQSVADAEAVVAAAAESGRTLMVGHLLEYHPGLVRLKELVDSGDLGDVHYIYGNRVNLGKVRADENALWSLGRARRVGGAAPGRGGAGASATPSASRTCATGSRTWCSASCASRPAWPRTCTCRGSTRTRSAASPSSGSRRMATFDDMAIEQKLTVYDKGVDQPYKSYGEYIARSGRRLVAAASPTTSRCGSSARTSSSASVSGRQPRSDGESGLRVVRVLERAPALARRGRRAPAATG